MDEGKEKEKGPYLEKLIILITRHVERILLPFWVILRYTKAVFPLSTSV